MRYLLMTILSFLVMVFSAWAHFQLLIPSQDIVTFEGPREIVLKIVFTHPMEGGPAMNMASPQAFGVFVNGQKFDLLSSLKAIKVPVYPCRNQGPEVQAFEARYLPRRPGDHLFYLLPQPYFEPAEGKFIQQITKVVVNAYGAEKGWDEALGLPVEIVPLVRPYGLFEGNLFQGLVLVKGKPAPGVEVEVEYYNRDCHLKVEGPFVTQVIRTDANGVFSYALPWSGWWGFSALTDGGTLSKGGQKYPLELDAVIWVKAYPKPKGSKK